jgi:hypothetical protein
MAKAKNRSRSTGLVRVNETIRVPAAKPQAIVIRQSAAPTKKPKGGHRRSSSTSGGNFMSVVGEPALAGAILGYLNKNMTTFPTIPQLGRAGTLALAAWFFRGKHKMLRNLAPGFAAIALYEWMYEGKIQGDVVGGVASQV